MTICKDIYLEIVSGRRVDGYGHSIMRDFTLMSNYFSEVELSKDELAHLISRGYLKNEELPAGEIIKLQIVQIKGREAKNRLLNIGNAVITKYRKELEELKEPLIKAVMDSTPPHLKKVQMYGLQHMFHCDGWFIMHCLKNLTDSGRLKLPAKDQQKSLTALAVTAE
jgi:hypothetical protein